MTDAGESAHPTERCRSSHLEKIPPEHLAAARFTTDSPTRTVWFSSSMRPRQAQNENDSNWIGRVHRRGRQSTAYLLPYPPRFLRPPVPDTCSYQCGLAAVSRMARFTSYRTVGLGVIVWSVCGCG